MLNPPAGFDPSLASPKAHLPRGEDFLLWPPCLQSYGYRIVDKLFATRAIRRGNAVRELPRGREIDVPLEDFMDHNNVAGLLVIQHGRVVLERYGLGLQPADRWSTMSTVKSMTSTLVGAAVHDGALQSLDDKVVRYLPQLKGSGYEQASVRHLLTMSSGVQWSEVYVDKNSDVNRYSKSLADKIPGGVLQMLQQLPLASAPGTAWNYNSGDTFLLGALLSAATGRTLADYMSEKIWQPCGMEFDAYYTLESEDGQEIGGSRAGMALRDMGRFALFVIQDGIVNAQRVLPEGWIDQAAHQAFVVSEPFLTLHCKNLGLKGYGFNWWLKDDGAMVAMGHSGQRIYIHRGDGLIVVQLAVYPEPRFAGANEPDRDAALNSLIQAVHHV